MARIIDSTPLMDGFFFPAEYERHAQTWLIWPERTDIYPFGAKDVQRTYIELATCISQYEKVTVCVSQSQFKNARAKLPFDIRVIEMSCDGGWVRDTGPSFLLNSNGLVRGVNWQFNAWGNTGYSPWDKDNLVAQKILEIENIDQYKAALTVEGGAFHSDGEGTLLVTEESIVNANRNPYLSRDQIEHALKEYLNVKKVIWLKRGIYLDEAGGHIDGLCCFLKPSLIALNWTEDENDPQFEISNEAYHILSKQSDAHGRSFEIIKIHQPEPQFITAQESESIDIVEGTVPRNTGDRLPASYINFYFLNNAIILPTFNSKFDDIAIRQLKKLLPDREIVPMYSRSILLGGGNIHCMTQQQPLPRNGIK